MNSARNAEFDNICSQGIVSGKRKIVQRQQTVQHNACLHSSLKEDHPVETVLLFI